ncbi:hypothetical protein [Streptomyces luteireticuli]|uniref:hypothetical protein n=1 Tax=Streptomyces luteireticuli TaxID=173858 RepID=UPI003557F5F8
MSRTTHHRWARAPHRRCTLLLRGAALAAIPSLFGGAPSLILLSLLGVASLGLGMFLYGARDRRCQGHAPSGGSARAAIASATDALLVLLIAAFLVAALCGSSGADLLATPGGLSAVAVLALLGVVHHGAHRSRSRR